jgi:hypothetical protein
MQDFSQRPLAGYDIRDSDRREVRAVCERFRQYLLEKAAATEEDPCMIASLQTSLACKKIRQLAFVIKIVAAKKFLEEVAKCWRRCVMI